MIVMTYAHARSLSQNRELLTKLFHTQMPTKTAKRMKRILERVGYAAKYTEEQQYTLQMQIAKETAELDEKGEPKFTPEGELVFKSDEARGEANKFMMANLAPILKKELSLVLDPLDLDDTQLELTLAEIDLLGPILTQDEGEEPTAPESA